MRSRTDWPWVVRTCAGIAALLLAAAGAGIGIAMAFVDEGPVEASQPAGAPQGVPVGSGDAFTFQQYDVAEGWVIGRGDDGKPTVKSMTLTNTWDADQTPALTFELQRPASDGEVLASVHCFGFGAAPGDSVEIGPWQCAGEGEMDRPLEWYQVVVKNMDLRTAEGKK